MKKLHILIWSLLFLTFKNAHSQSGPVKANVGIGFGVGTHLKTGGLGFVIGRYNDTRSYLSTQMKEPRFFRGINLALDVYYPRCLVDMEIVQRKSDVFAETGQTAQRRDFRYKVNSFNFGVGLKMNTKRSGVMGSYLGIDFSTVIVKNYTRVYKTAEKKPEFERINRDLIIGFSPFLQYVGNRLTLKVYYQFMLNSPNYWDVNMKINPNTWSGDEYYSNKGKTSSVGICTRFNLFKNGG